MAVVELPDRRQARFALRQQVHAGDPQVGDAVLDELDDVGGADEQDVELEVLDMGHEPSIVLVEEHPGIAQEGDARFREPALVGDREAEALGHRSEPTGYGRSGAARRPDWPDWRVRSSRRR